MDFIQEINEYYEREKKVIDALNREELNAAMNCLLDAYERGAYIYVFGCVRRRLASSILAALPRPLPT